MRHTTVNIYLIESGQPLRESLQNRYPRFRVELVSGSDIEMPPCEPSCVVVDARTSSTHSTVFSQLYRMYRPHIRSLWPPMVLLVSDEVRVQDPKKMESDFPCDRDGHDIECIEFDGDVAPLCEVINRSIALHRRRIDHAKRLRTIRGRYETFTARQRRVAEHLLQGKSNKWIAGRLNVSNRTIEDDRASLFKKMHVENAVHLAKLLTELRMMEMFGSHCDCIPDDAAQPKEHR